MYLVKFLCFKFLAFLDYRVIHKALRDFRPLRYSSRDGHAEGEHVNRGRDTPSFCTNLQVLDMCTIGDVADVNLIIKFLRHGIDSRWCHCIFHCNIPSDRFMTLWWNQSLLKMSTGNTSSG
jgi:hypothetical protein